MVIAYPPLHLVGGKPPEQFMRPRQTGPRIAAAFALRCSETWLRHNIVAAATHNHQMQNPWPQKISLRSGEQATCHLSEWL